MPFDTLPGSVRPPPLPQMVMPPPRPVIPFGEIAKEIVGAVSQFSPRARELRDMQLNETRLKYQTDVAKSKAMLKLYDNYGGTGQHYKWVGGVPVPFNDLEESLLKQRNAKIQSDEEKAGGFGALIDKSAIQGAGNKSRAITPSPHTDTSPKEYLGDPRIINPKPLPKVHLFGEADTTPDQLGALFADNTTAQPQPDVPDDTGGPVSADLPDESEAENV